MSNDTIRPKTDDVHNEPLSSMGRRRFLSVVTGAGFAIGTAKYLTPEDFEVAASDQVPIVYGMARSNPDDLDSLEPRKKLVPADWYNDLQAATRVKEKVDFIHWDGVKGVGVIPGEYGGQNASVEVDILHRKADQLHGRIPEEIDGVPIDLREVGEGKPGGCNQNDAGENVPGSMVCVGDANSPVGTLAAPLIKNGKPYFSTCKHIFEGTGSEVTGKLLFHPDKNSAAIGEIVDTHCFDDFVVADPINIHTPDTRIEGASPDEVIGQFSKSGLSDLKAQGEPLHKIGITTCHTKGQIGSVDAQTSHYGCVPKDGQVTWGTCNDFDDGDSGSVTYHPDPDNPNSFIMIGSFCNAREPEDLGCDFTWGTGAYRIRNQWGYHF